MEINPRLLRDTLFVADLEICELRLLKDELIWFVLIPKIEGAVELTDLDFDKQRLVLEDINLVSSRLKKHHVFDKLNIATIGNIVEQLHVHIIARTKNDRAWPNTIWGTKPSVDSSKEMLAKWQQIFNE